MDRFSETDPYDYAKGDEDGGWQDTSEEEDDCHCRFDGDQADASECPRHGMSAPVGPRIGDTTVVEQWIGMWISRTLVWDGKSYVREVA